MTERSLDRLPKWAQNEINRLRRDLAYAKAKLAAGPDNSSVFADPYSDPPPSPLGNAHIEFRIDDRRFQASLEGDTLKVYGSGRLAVYPSASNVLHIRCESF